MESCRSRLGPSKNKEVEQNHHNSTSKITDIASIGSHDALMKALQHTKEEMKKKGQESEENMPVIICETFNRAMQEFIDDLKCACPDNVTLHVAEIALTAFRKYKPSEPMNRWLKGIQGHEHALEARTPKNEEYFLKHVPKMEYVNELEIERYWHTFSDRDKDCVWKHLQWLNLLATTLQCADKKQINSIAEIAEVVALNTLENSQKNNEKIDPKNIDKKKLYNETVQTLINNQKFLDALNVSKEDVQKAAGMINPNSLQSLLRIFGKAIPSNE